MDEYNELIGCQVEVHLTDGAEITGLHLDRVALIYGSVGGYMLILVDAFDEANILAVPTSMVQVVTAD